MLLIASYYHYYIGKNSQQITVELVGNFSYAPTTLLYSLLITCYLNNCQICYDFRFIVKFYTIKKENQSLILFFFFFWHIDLK